ncbi:M20 family metallopeptidase [soil metagenome]
MKKIFLPVLLLSSFACFAQDNLRSRVVKLSDSVESSVIAWRRDIHEHPELGNNEFRTAAIVAKYLKSLGMEVKTGIAKTGVVGILKGGKPGPVVALRADMDALPVTEIPNVPFASKVKTTYNGKETGVMHACGHDSHVAILMGVAEILAAMQKDIHGTVIFIFQPAEEGAPVGETGGAEVMVKEGVLDAPKVDVIFGLHIMSQQETGTIAYRPGGEMAGATDMKITVKGKPAHGASPWNAVDPIVVSAQIINSLQTIISRNLNITENPGVITIGAINGGNRGNIIPEQVVMEGTIRSFSNEDEQMLISRVKQIATKTAEAAGATVDLQIPYTTHYPVTFNNIALTEKMLPSLQQTAGAGNVKLIPAKTGAEDFSFFAQKVPGLFIFLGGMPKDGDPKTAPSHHTPAFFIDESGFKLGMQALANLTLDYMQMNSK